MAAPSAVVREVQFWVEPPGGFIHSDPESQTLPVEQTENYLSICLSCCCWSHEAPAEAKHELPAFQKSSGQPVFSLQPSEGWSSGADLQVGPSTALISLCVSVLQMDPVQKAVLHHTLGLPPTAKRKHVSCGVCQLRFNSQVRTCFYLQEAKGQRSLELLHRGNRTERGLY